MTDSRLLDLVDARDFRTLFVDELGWDNPDRPAITVELDAEIYEIAPVASYKGLRIWHCPVVPPRKTQREIDVVVGKDNLERLVIFSNSVKQEWRWPRRAQMSSTNSKLLAHEHIVGDRHSHLAQRLKAVELDFDDRIPLVTLLERMRDAFDNEAESASVAAARLMGSLYSELEDIGVSDRDSTLLLARLLFLFFGDDADMWTPANLFENYLRRHVTAENLHVHLPQLFTVLDTEEGSRNLAPDSPFQLFRYINGGLFRDSFQLPKLTPRFYDALIDACEFDWQIISPAVFGSMFQTVRDREARRRGGEHYTTEENILKTIQPLFLDEYRVRFDRSKDDKAQLTKLHNDLGRLRFLDPACGCGNFLIVAYRELRALELEILKQRRDLDLIDPRTRKIDRSQLSIDVTGDIKVTLDHFCGIEHEEWPARIAETAMLLVDHLANEQMKEEFGVPPDRLPITIAPTILHKNAIHTDWESVVPASDDVIILGNPPFIGMAWLSLAQQADNRRAFALLPEATGLRSGRLDYVASWYAKTLAYLRGTKGRAAFVSTNSLTQGEQARTMLPLMDRCGFEVDFGHQTFKWKSEAPGAAAVHCVIIGFSSKSRANKQRRLFTYPQLTGAPVEVGVQSLNFYLVDGPNLVPEKLRAPLTAGMPHATQGNKPVDGGHLLIKDDQEYAAAAGDPIASRYLRKFVQARYMLNNTPYWCLWMKGADLRELRKSALLDERLNAVAVSRVDSPTASVQAFAARPHVFTQDRQPTDAYFALPEVSSENRKWIPGRFYESDVIAGNKLIIFPRAQTWHAGLLQSSMFMTWVHVFAGRLKSDPSISPGLAYFPVPFPRADSTLTDQLATAWQRVEAARAEQGLSLADLYEERAMPASLRTAHHELDAIVDRAFGANRTCTNAEERKKILFARYIDAMNR